jgi:hypothetical protein
MKVAIHITFWALMAISALCKLNDTNIETYPALIISGYLGGVLVLELILFYVGYAFANKFLDGKRKYLFLGIVLVGYIFFVILLPIVVRGGVAPFEPLKFWALSLSNFIDSFAWLVAGIIARHFFDAFKVSKSCGNEIKKGLNRLEKR